MIATNVVWSDCLQGHRNVLLEMLYRFEVRPGGRGGVVAANEFLPHPLDQCGHRELLSLRLTYSSNHHTAQVGRRVSGFVQVPLRSLQLLDAVFWSRTESCLLSRELGGIREVLEVLELESWACE